MRAGALAMVMMMTWTMTTSCDREPFEESMELGGEVVSAETLNHGYGVYRRYCIGCHGEDGDGSGTSASRMDVPPRDFTSGHFKFKSVPDEGLPTDADLHRVIRGGLKGTNMNPVAIPEADVEAVAAYIKTFSPRWRSESPGEPVEMSEDPWEDVEAAERRGRELYHGDQMCWRCHPAYASREQILGMVREVAEAKGEKAPKNVPMRSALGEPQRLETVYGKQLPPDLVNGTFRAGRSDFALFRTLSAGIGGTRMKGLHDTLESRDIWSLVHYVRGLQRHRSRK